MPASQAGRRRFDPGRPLSPKPLYDQRFDRCMRGDQFDVQCPPLDVARAIPIVALRARGAVSRTQSSTWMPAIGNHVTADRSRSAASSDAGTVRSFDTLWSSGPNRHAEERRGNGRGPRRGALVLVLEERHQLLL